MLKTRSTRGRKYSRHLREWVRESTLGVFANPLSVFCGVWLPVSFYVFYISGGWCVATKNRRYYIDVSPLKNASKTPPAEKRGAVGRDSSSEKYMSSRGATTGLCWSLRSRVVFAHFFYPATRRREHNPSPNRDVLRSLCSQFFGKPHTVLPCDIALATTRHEAVRPVRHKRRANLKLLRSPGFPQN